MKHTYDVKVFRSNAGLGLATTKDLNKGDFIIEYHGEIIDSDEADRRANRYLFEIDDEWTIDGSARDNLARYINHSCRPNCEAESDEDERKIRIYAKKKIAAGEELTYDYGKAHFDEYIKPYGCKCEKCQTALRKAH